MKAFVSGKGRRPLRTHPGAQPVNVLSSTVRSVTSVRHSCRTRGLGNPGRRRSGLRGAVLEKSAADDCQGPHLAEGCTLRRAFYARSVGEGSFCLSRFNRAYLDGAAGSRSACEGRVEVLCADLLSLELGGHSACTAVFRGQGKPRARVSARHVRPGTSKRPLSHGPGSKGAKFRASGPTQNLSALWPTTLGEQPNL